MCQQFNFRLGYPLQLPLPAAPLSARCSCRLRTAATQAVTMRAWHHHAAAAAAQQQLSDAKTSICSQIEPNSAVTTTTTKATTTTTTRDSAIAIRSAHVIPQNTHQSKEKRKNEKKNRKKLQLISFNKKRSTDRGSERKLKIFHFNRISDIDIDQCTIVGLKHQNTTTSKYLERHRVWGRH